MASPKLADILMHGGGDVTTADLTAAIAERQKRGALPNFDASGRWSPTAEVRANAAGYNPKDTIVDDAKAAAASAADPFGLPSAAVGLYSPSAKEGWRETYESRPAAAVAGSVAAPFGLYAKGLKWAGDAIRSAPKLSTALLAGLGLTAAPDEASPQTLTTKQKRTIEAENTRAKAAQDRELEAERIRGEQALKQKNAEAEAARQQQEADRLAAENVKKEEANKSFREKYPEVADKLPAIGLAAAMGVPYAGKVVNQYVRSAPARMLDREIGAARAGAEAKNADAISTATPTMSRILQDYKAGDASMAGRPGIWPQVGAHAGAGLVGGGISAETNMFPEQWDAINLPEGEKKDKARSYVLNPLNYAERAAIGAATGMSGIHMPVYSKTPKTAVAQGLIDKYGTTPESAVKAIYASKAAEAGEQTKLADILRQGIAPTERAAGRPAEALTEIRTPSASTTITPERTTNLPGGAKASQSQPQLPSQSTASGRGTSDTSPGSASSGSEPSLSSVLKGESGHHSVRQNRVKGKFSPGFKGEKE